MKFNFAWRATGCALQGAVKLAGQGSDLRTVQDYLGHRDPKHTAHYTRVAEGLCQG
ncbi:MAG: tyrosine-type recombinase/integrase [Hyphomicrobiaceae bacterium]